MSAQPISALSVPDRLAMNADQFRLLLKQFKCAFRVALICEVQSFNPGPPATATVQPVTMESMNQNVSGSPVATNTNLPLLVDVPVVTIGGGDYVLTMPIQEGDEAIVLFSDMDFDSWFQSGGTGNAQVAKDRHDLWDGVAIVGPRSTPNAIDDYNPNYAELRNLAGTVKLGFTNSGFLLTGDLVVTGMIHTEGNLQVDGGATFNGTTDFTGTTVIGGITWSTHTHSGVSTGASDTGPPV